MDKKTVSGQQLNNLNPIRYKFKNLITYALNLELIKKGINIIPFFCPIDFKFI
jgi:hypothetical protein